MRAKRLWPVMLLAVLLLAGCGEVPTAGLGGALPTPTLAAYPVLPTGTPEPTWPPLPTMTPWPTVPITPQPTYSGPPKPTEPVTPMLPFPTPAFLPAPPGTPPPDLQEIWYPYFPAPDARPMLRAVLVDGQGRRWGDLGRAIDLWSIPGLLGSKWGNLYISLDGRSFVAETSYIESSRPIWINPSSGEARPIAAEPNRHDFLAWGSDRQILVRGDSRGDIWLLNLDTEEHHVVPFPTSQYGDSLVRALATSPDGSMLADVCIYGPTTLHPGSDITVSVQPLTGGDRVPISASHIPLGADMPGNLLTWSPDGQSLVFTLFTGMYDNDASNDDSQLWLIDKGGGSPRILAHGLTGYHPVAWSPNGRYIAYIRAKEPTWMDSPADLWLFDLTTSTEIQLTRYTDQRVTSVMWSPGGEMLAFAVTLEDYGEIWITPFDGSEQYPVAGPTAPDAPVAWLPTMEGGR